MWRLPTPFSKRVQAKRARARQPRWYRPILESLEDRYLLTVSLLGPTSGLVGSPGTWTATATGDGTTPVYQFSVVPNGGVAQVVKDFSTSNSFVWNPMQEGNYTVEVAVKSSFSATTGESTSTSYTANTRITGTSAVVSPTSNPLIALFSAPPSSGSSMYVQYSPDVSNPTWLSTSSESIVAGESTNFLVTGMLPNTKYLMRYVLNDGTTSTPLTFTTGSLPTNLTFPTFTVNQGPTSATDLTQNMVYHVGISTAPGTVDNVATDLSGNINWYYDPTTYNFYGYGPTLEPGGTIYMLGGTSIGGAGGFDTLREIDLLGDPLHETNINAINAQLAAMGKDPIFNLSHDAVLLPNGNTAVIAGTQRVINVNGTPTTYTADDVLVLDQNFQVKWVWDSLDWLDPTRLPTNGEGPADFTHANSISWSPEDGNLVVSLRSQDWVVKINYNNGAGDGHIIWTLGAGGNFTVNSSAASPWFSHQHDVEYINDNTLIVFDDGNTRRLTDPTADSRGQEWVLNEQTMTATLVVNADLGNYSSALGSAQVLPNGNLDFTSGLLGAPPFVGQSIEVSPDGTVNYVLQYNSGLEYRSYFMSTLYGGMNFDYGLLDSGFEDPSVGTGTSAYQYDPASSAWSYNGTAGVAGNGSAVTSGNPNAPEGSQVAFIQGTSSISQVVNFQYSGTYQLGLLAAQRGNNGTSNEAFQVLVDGTVVATITPNSTNYNTFTTPTFSLSAGSHTITFVGVDPTGADYTALLDQVNVQAVVNRFSDPGFETPNVGTGSWHDFVYNPSGAPWTYSSSSGVAGNGSGFTNGNPNAPQGTQVAFLQKNGTMSQVVNFTAGTYAISFYAAQRYGQGSSQTFEVTVDGTVVGTFTPTSTTYKLYTTNSFTVTAGTHTIEFIGLNPNGGDNTAFLDGASIQQPATNQFNDPGFETPNVGTGAFSDFARNTSGSPWLYSNYSGVAGNGSGFTDRNPNAPQGTQVAFLQDYGTMSQAVNFTAGTYTISFYAAQRYGQSSSQKFEVTVDGTVVGTFTPSGTSYSAYTTNAFTVSAGMHTVEFIGLDPSGGDNTALIDQSVIQTTNQFVDPGFETPNVGTGPSAYLYNPSGASWTYSGSSGVAGNGSAFTSGNSDAPQGTQVAFIQATGTISEVVNFTAGTYTISFDAAQRANYQASSQTFEVTVDGKVVGTFTPNGTTYSLYTTNSFTVTAGTHTVEFIGLDPDGQDNTAFIDGANVTTA